MSSLLERAVASVHFGRKIILNLSMNLMVVFAVARNSWRECLSAWFILCEICIRNGGQQYCLPFVAFSYCVYVNVVCRMRIHRSINHIHTHPANAPLQLAQHRQKRSRGNTPHFSRYWRIGWYRLSEGFIIRFRSGKLAKAIWFDRCVAVDRKEHVVVRELAHIHSVRCSCWEWDNEKMCVCV